MALHNEIIAKYCKDVFPNFLQETSSSKQFNTNKYINIEERNRGKCLEYIFDNKMNWHIKRIIHIQLVML